MASSAAKGSLVRDRFYKALFISQRLRGMESLPRQISEACISTT